MSSFFHLVPGFPLPPQRVTRKSALPAIVEWLGEGNILYASDYPHWDSKFPDSVSTLADRVDVSDLFKRKIFLDNPCR